MLQGIDFSFGNGLTTDEIKATGHSFVCRYLSGGFSKDINAAELAAYRTAGIAVILVWETTGVDMVSHAAGVADAQAAQAELGRLAAALKDASVAEAVVFFAADEAAEPDMPDYMRGASSVLGKARTGIYGGYGSVHAAFDDGLVSYGWQTLAWSAGEWDDRALLRQVQNNVRVGPATVDLDQAAYWASATKTLGVHDDFGQWPRPSVTPKPKPDPQPVPSPAPEVPEMSELDTTIASHPLLIPFGVKTMDLLSVNTEGAPLSITVTFLNEGGQAKPYTLSWGTADTVGSGIVVPAGNKKARIDVVSGGGLPLGVRFNQ